MNGTRSSSDRSPSAASTTTKPTVADTRLYARTDSTNTAVTKPGGGVKTPVEPSPRSSTSTGSHCHQQRTSTGVTPKVVYGAGAVSRLPTELGKLSLSAPLIVSSPSRISLARRVQALIPNLDTRILDSALVNVPQRVVDDAVGRVSGRDSVISVGGASAMRLAKAIASRKGIPHICIPTTYAGSESPLLGDMRRRQSRSRRQRGDKSTASSKKNNEDDTQTMPQMVIYDEDLTSMNSTMTISAPNEAKPHASRASTDEDSQWSYIHLPGV